MGDVVKLKLTEEQNITAYDPNRGWKTTVQPRSESDTPYTVDDYYNMAQWAQDDLTQKEDAFYERNDFNVLRVSHEEFLTYETGTLPFREWLEKYCHDHNKNADSYDICHVGPCVKSATSARRKTATGSVQPHEVIDYIRSMPVVLKKNPNYKKNKTSLAVLKNLIVASEADYQTLAHKNYFWNPHPATGMRAFKALWEAGNEGMEILAEIKIEHESQMDIDRLTRYFLNYGRAADTCHTKMFNTCVCTKTKDQDYKRASKTATAMKERTTLIRKWGKMLYDRVNYDAGFDAELSRPLEKHEKVSKPKTLEQIRTIIEKDLKTISCGQDVFRQKIQASGIFPDNSSLGRDRLTQPSTQELT